MLNLLKTPIRVAGTLFAAGLLLMAQGRVARPGTVNYSEGQVLLNGSSVSAKQIGSAEVAPGEILQTRQGKAEMLLTPGVFLRLSDNTAVRMVSPSLTDTRVELLKGEAMLEADQVQHENHLAVIDNGFQTQIEKKGIYRFNADTPLVAVYDGKAKVIEDDRTVDVGKGKELPLVQTTGKLKPQKFDKNETDALYEWSKVRSSYVAEANMATAQTLVVEPGGWYGTGWYWNPYYSSWAFMPGSGYLYSPFGFGFYSPSYWSYYAPYYYPAYGYYGGHYGGYRGVYGRYSGRVGVGRPAPAPATPAAPVGGSGVQFGAPAQRSMAAPRMGNVAPRMGGSGMRFGGGRRR